MINFYLRKAGANVPVGVILALHLSVIRILLITKKGVEEFSAVLGKIGLRIRNNRLEFWG